MMIEKIIASLKEDLIKNSDAETLYNQYVEKKSLEEQIVNNEEKVKELEEEKRNLEERLYSYSFFQSLFKRKDILVIKEQIKNLEIKIEENRKNIEQIKETYEKIQIDEEKLKIIEQYVRVLDMEKDYSSGRYDEVIDGMLEVFNSDFSKLISFCKENNISLNFSDYDSEEKSKAFGKKFIEKFSKLPMPEKYSDLSQLCMVRKVNKEAMPKGDRIVPVTYVKGKNRIRETSIEYDGEIYTNIKFEEVGSHPTISWYLNGSVQSHPGGDWSDKELVIIQPMNESIYRQVAGLNPVDIVFEGPVNLEKYFIICNSEETKREVEANNKDATVFVLNKEDYINSIGFLLSKFGYYQLFRDYEGHLDGSYKRVEDLYDYDFLTKYPKFETHLAGGPNNTIHNSRSTMWYISEISSKLNFVLDKARQEESFDEVFRKIFEAFSSNSLSGIGILHDEKINLEEIFVQGIDKKEISFLSNLILMNNEKFNPQDIFDLIIDGVIVNDENRDSLLKIKEEIISTILNYNAKIEENKINGYSFDIKFYEDLILRLFIFRKMAISDVINKKVVSSINYKQIMEYCDFSKLGQFCNYMAEKYLSEGKVIDYDFMLDIVKNICNSPTNFFEFNLSSPQENYINAFIKRIEYISGIKDETKRQEALNTIICDLSDDNLKEMLVSFVEEYQCSRDLKSKMSNISLAITTMLRDNLELSKQENVGIKR